MLDADNTDHADLRGGNPPWRHAPQSLSGSPLTRNTRCQVLVVGAGITGALMAEHLTSRDFEVVILEKEEPIRGSTAASTSMLLWEIDRSLSDLTSLYGFERAVNIYRRSLQAVSGLMALVRQQQLHCAFRDRYSLYLASAETDPKALQAEHELRQRANLPGFFLDDRKLASEFGFERNGAILSPGSADADPVCLTHALLQTAIRRGARLVVGEAQVFDGGAKSVIVGLADDHVIEAEYVVLATGYAMPDIVHSDLHRTSSSWAIATAPQLPTALWRGGVLIWEASEKYLYARTTTDNRIVVGGEDDESIVEQDDRDRLMPRKKEIILAKLKALYPAAEASAAFAWSGAFGQTGDGLPLIGRVPGHRRLHAAYGYGGNGITFSFLASRMIARMIAGEFERWFEDFAIDRPAPKP
ncbi:FAD-dependent oxidoreductase [Roseiarcaceae bacterium H3SJ34-1]|uniref:NAD(P)/FAD-dependent oxidoreductase n=1 Tax=Terripilifer ovatus TaxID=3032367 RepID=UPI003AB99E07|nr:FAD-dependent oxidoreductase [Roseiarcaceae bacterium H3SJ34-1]